MTKLLVGLVALCAAVAIATGVYVVLWNRDPVPGDVEACIRKAGLPLARSTAALSVVRADAAAGSLKVVRRFDWGRTDGVLLAGPSADYALLALWNGDTPSLAAGDVGRRLYDGPGRFPVVAVEAPHRRALLACANAVDA